MKRTLLPRVTPALLLAASALAQGPAGKPAPVLFQPVDMLDRSGRGTVLKDVDAALVPDKPVVMPGEPFFVSFTVKNHSARRIEAVEAIATGTSEARLSNIRLTATAGDGSVLPKFNTGIAGFPFLAPLHSAPAVEYHTVVIPPGDSRIFRVLASRSFLLETPGSYTVTMRAIFGAPLNDHTNATDSALITATAVIKVAPADAKKLAAIARGLKQKAASGTSDTQSLEAAAKLQWFPDERGIPACMDAELKNGGGDAAVALFALSDIAGDAGAFAIFKKLLETRGGGDDLRASVAAAIEKSPDPGAIPYLLTRWNDPSPDVRLVVVDALRQKVPRDRALPLLRKMAEDKDEKVSDAANNALRAATGDKPAS